MNKETKKGLLLEVGKSGSSQTLIKGFNGQVIGKKCLKVGLRPIRSGLWFELYPEGNRQF